MSLELNGLRPLFTESQFEQWMDFFQEDAEEKIIELLDQAGEHAVKIAREGGDYGNITGNLRSSVGYLVMKDGKIVKEWFKMADEGTDRKTGAEEGRKLAYAIAGEYQTGFALIVVAGMDYAAEVEARGRDVLSGAAGELKDYLDEEVKLVLVKIA